MQEDSKLHEGEIRLDERNTFLKWLDNYWYHYKWHTLIAGFFVLLFLFTLGQCAVDTNHDIVVAYCGSTGFLNEQTEGVRNALEDALPEDFDGNGEKYVEFVRYQYYSQQEIEAEVAEHDGEWSINIAYVNQQLKQFKDFVQLSIASNDCSVYLLSPAVYDLFTTNPFRRLSDVFDETPAAAYDEYAVRLGDTAFYANDSKLQEILPPDTLVCLLSSNRPEQDSYDHAIAMFSAIVKE